MNTASRSSPLLSIAVVLAVSGCGDGGCGFEPLPGGALPAHQTVEGGGQIRVTRAGFTKLTALIPVAINDLVGDGFCVGNGQWGDPDGDWGTGLRYCNTNVNGACGAALGCDVNVHTDFVRVTVPDTQRLNVAVQIDFDTVVHLDYQVFGGDGSCDMDVVGNNIYLDVDIVFDIDPADGELDVHLGQVGDYDLSGVVFSNCGAVSSFGNFARDFLESWFGQWVVDAFTPALDDLVRGMLPDPLGVEGMIDIGALLEGISPGTEASMEARIVPGGYVQLRNNGMSVGLITGLNSDEDPSTRTAMLDSEPSYCVPPLLAPNFAAPPASLAASSRGTFTLQPAEEFLGAPEPSDDLVMGLSETTLDLGGHHAVTSGAMCLGVGTSVIAQLNLGTFSLLVPSLGNLGEADNPVLLVTRPQRALDISIGTGTESSPALSLAIEELEADVYVYVYERYVRAFTMRLDLTLGVNLTFEQAPGTPATITPELVGLDADNIEVAVINSDFVQETPEELEEVLPTIFDLAVGLLGDGLGSFEVPDFAGFTLNNLRIQKVTTSEDDFLALYASLGSSAQMRELSARLPSLQPALAEMDRGVTRGAPVVAAAARLTAVTTPAPEQVRAALGGDAGGAMPMVTIAVPAHDAAGRVLEHAWRLAGGPWRPYRTGDELAIADRAFAWQARYTVEVRSRVVGDYTTTTEPVGFAVIIDSVAPDILVAEATIDDDALVVPARDLVTPRGALRYAWGRPGDDAPWTDWAVGGSLARETLDDLVVAGEVAVWVKDEAGNVSVMLAPVPFHGQAGAGGCNCEVGGGGGGAGGALLLLVMVVAGSRPRRRTAE